MKRVAIYARVSTEHEAQISALGNQVQYYDEILKQHKDWTLYERYIDEGITGTSVNKRKNFMRMMDDARDGKFDLIITREVSRFARNTVDTLQQTRILKNYGVEVWFTEDNIWTKNDEDGELRLTIMATLAQNESKKISSRVKAGQMISFKNGVLYGNGNILGYNKVGNNFIINKEQAETVKRIFQLYLSGYGIRKIQFAMEQEGRLTANGLKNWSASNINRVIHNAFYCGRIEYRKQYVPDYLMQKKVNNHGEIERVIVKGNHEPIISEELFDEAQRISASKTTKKDGVTRGKTLADNIFVKKLRCECGAAFNRRVSYVSKAGDKTYTFQCYNQLHTGTITTRRNKGLSIEGVCDSHSFPQWKVELQADFIFRKLISNKQEIFDTANKLLKKHLTTESDGINYADKIEKSLSEIDRLKRKIEVLVDMCTDGDISRELFNEKKITINSKIKTLESAIEGYKQKINSSKSEEELNERVYRLSRLLEVQSFQNDEPIPSEIIDKYVQKIIVHKDCFEWIMTSDFQDDNNQLFLKTSKKRSTDKDDKKSKKTMCYVNDNTGCYQRNTLILKPIFLGTYNVSKDYMKSVLPYYKEDDKYRLPEKVTIKLSLS